MVNNNYQYTDYELLLQQLLKQMPDMQAKLDETTWDKVLASIQAFATNLELGKDDQQRIQAVKSFRETIFYDYPPLMPDITRIYAGTAFESNSVPAAVGKALDPDRVAFENQIKAIFEFDAQIIDHPPSELELEKLETKSDSLESTDQGSSSSNENQEKADRHINAWLTQNSEEYQKAVQIGVSYALNLQVGEKIASSLIEGAEARVPVSDIPTGGLQTHWIITSSTVEIQPSSDGISLSSEIDDQTLFWTARFDLLIPQSGEGEQIALNIVPRFQEEAELNASIYIGHEIYRKFSIQLPFDAMETIASDSLTAGTMIHRDFIQTPLAHTKLQPSYEWTTPPGRTIIDIDNIVFINGEDRAKTINKRVLWNGGLTSVAGDIEKVRESAEKFRVEWGRYLNDIEPSDLKTRLENWRPDYSWDHISNLGDRTHDEKWDEAKVSPELRALAYNGHRLYENFFPRNSPIREWLDSVTHGHRLDISWLRSSGSVWIPHIPWGLMYLPELPDNLGSPIDPQGFLGLRFRLGYSAHETQNSSKALGPSDSSHVGHFLYWGGKDTDKTLKEAQWQRDQFGLRQNQVFVPSAPLGSTPKEEMQSMLRNPSPSPMPILYFFCQCKVGNGNNPVLRFGDRAAAHYEITRTELSTRELIDSPLVFANACTTSGGDGYMANDLELNFFSRGCRAYIGTETKVPIEFASRFAAIFFYFFNRKPGRAPLAAGEAFTQTKLFLWSHYRNIGGLFYTYINQYELFLADSDEVVQLK